MRNIVLRYSGSGWKGPPEGCPDKEFIEFDDQFRPILKPEYHSIMSPKDAVLAPPDRQAEDPMDFLDAYLRDMTGVLYTTRHFLTHGAEDGKKRPCWTCDKAGSRQRKKFQLKFKRQQDKHPRRVISKFGDHGTGDHAKITDFYQRGGVHGAKELYTHVDVRTECTFAFPVAKKDDEQTLKAINHIYGNHPRRRYYCDNAAPLTNAVFMAGLQVETSTPGISQTNGVAEANNKTILVGTRRLLCQAGLPACWWPYAAHRAIRYCAIL